MMEDLCVGSNSSFGFDYTKVNFNLNLLDVEEKKKFSEHYDTFKNSYLVKDCLSMCNNLIPYKTFIGNQDQLNHRFILKLPGIEFCPFPKHMTTLNIKHLFVLIDTYQTKHVSAKEQTIKYIMLVLNKLYVNSHKLYEIISSPDIDVNEFVDVIMSNLGEVKKHIPRCNEAFKKIEDSVFLLKDNFSDYYKDFMSTGNQMIIMENFVLDVSKSTKADAKTTRQFREIIRLL